MRNMILAFAVVTITAGTATADCTSEVNDAFAKLRKSEAFRMETKITNPTGTLTMSNDYVLPDRMHQTVSMGGDGPQEMQMILVGGKAWSNQGNAGWAEVPEKFATTIAKQMKDTVVEPPKDESQFECLGDVSFEGKTYAAYKTKRTPGAATEGAAAAPAAPAPATGAAAAAPAAPAPAPAADANVQTVYIDKALGVPARNIVTSVADPNKRLFDGTFSLRAGLKIDPPKL